MRRYQLVDEVPRETIIEGLSIYRVRPTTAAELNIRWVQSDRDHGRVPDVAKEGDWDGANAGIKQVAIGSPNSRGLGL
jgi:hypothetical protein